MPNFAKSLVTTGAPALLVAYATVGCAHHAHPLTAAESKRRQESYAAIDATLNNPKQVKKLSTGWSITGVRQ